MAEIIFSEKTPTIAFSDIGSILFYRNLCFCYNKSSVIGVIRASAALNATANKIKEQEMNCLKTTLAILLALTAALPVFSAEKESAERNPRMMRERGGNRGFRGFGRMQNQRAEAEQKLKAQYPAEFAEIQKLRDEAEKKLQELAKKANIELPAPPKSMQERMAELKAKFPKEYAEYEELMKTDRRAAFRKMQEIMEKNGEKMNFPGRGGRNTPPQPPRENQGRKMRELREKYPEEFAEIQKVRRENPRKAREMTQELLKKLNNESKK